jgi:hypothetical protein
MNLKTAVSTGAVGISIILIGLLADTTSLWDKFFGTKTSPPNIAITQPATQEANSKNNSTSVNSNNGSTVTIQQQK